MCQTLLGLMHTLHEINVSFELKKKKKLHPHLIILLVYCLLSITLMILLYVLASNSSNYRGIQNLAIIPGGKY
jgi:uncharacterized membrane protein AbrB (regulator of aidB expression)